MRQMIFESFTVNTTTSCPLRSSSVSPIAPTLRNHGSTDMSMMKDWRNERTGNDWQLGIADI